MYKIEYKGGRAWANADIIANLLGWSLKTVLDNAGKDVVLRSKRGTVKILEVAPLILPAWILKLTKYEVEINGGRAIMDKQTVMELAGLLIEERDRIREGAEFNIGEGKKLKILREFRPYHAEYAQRIFG